MQRNRWMRVFFFSQARRIVYVSLCPQTIKYPAFSHLFETQIEQEHSCVNKPMASSTMGHMSPHIQRPSEWQQQPLTCRSKVDKLLAKLYLWHLATLQGGDDKWRETRESRLKGGDVWQSAFGGWLCSENINKDLHQRESQVKILMMKKKQRARLI